MDPFYYLCFVFVCHTVLSVPCSLVLTWWERADLLYLGPGSGVVLECIDS